MKTWVEVSLFILIASGLLVAMLIAGCKAPPISELLKDGVNCKATITMPETRPGETVDVAVKIYECHEVTK